MNPLNSSEQLSLVANRLCEAINELALREDEEKKSGDLEAAKVTAARIERLYSAHRDITVVAIAEGK